MSRACTQAATAILDSDMAAADPMLAQKAEMLRRKLGIEEGTIEELVTSAVEILGNGDEVDGLSLVQKLDASLNLLVPDEFEKLQRTFGASWQVSVDGWMDRQTLRVWTLCSSSFCDFLRMSSSVSLVLTCTLVASRLRVSARLSARQVTGLPRGRWRFHRHASEMCHVCAAAIGATKAATWLDSVWAPTCVYDRPGFGAQRRCWRRWRRRSRQRERWRE